VALAGEVAMPGEFGGIGLREQLSFCILLRWFKLRPPGETITAGARQRRDDWHPRRLGV